MFMVFVPVLWIDDFEYSTVGEKIIKASQKLAEFIVSKEKA